MKTIIDLHGGTIDIRNLHEARGCASRSCFKPELPIPAPSIHGTKNASSSSTTNPASPGCSSSPSNAPAAIIVQEENDGTKAWLAAREFKPDIIFLDIVMPKIDGGDVAQQIRSDPMLAHVPIIFLTAIVSETETKNEIGGFPFIAKPVSLDAITRCIAEHLLK